MQLCASAADNGRESSGCSNCSSDLADWQRVNTFLGSVTLCTLTLCMSYFYLFTCTIWSSSKADVMVQL
jgi:hypothetical protein